MWKQGEVGFSLLQREGQRCTRSRPAQLTCRPLAVAVAPNPSGSLAVRADGDGASLIAAAKLLLGEVAVAWLDLVLASAN